MVTDSDDPIEDVTLILLLGVLWPGMGQLFQKRVLPGVLFGLLAAAFVAGALTLSTYQVALWIGAGLVAIWSILDLIVVARRASRVREARANH